MENKYPFQKIVIRKDIENLSKLAEQYDQAAEEAYQDWLVMKEEEISHRGGCFDCPQGNGEGGCTIPGYCLKYDIEEQLENLTEHEQKTELLKFIQIIESPDLQIWGAFKKRKVEV